jgi:hypothetical protein
MRHTLRAVFPTIDAQSETAESAGLSRQNRNLPPELVKQAHPNAALFVANSETLADAHCL